MRGISGPCEATMQAQLALLSLPEIPVLVSVPLVTVTGAALVAAAVVVVAAAAAIGSRAAL